MSIKTYLLIISLATLLAWLSWFMVVMNMNPDTGGLRPILFFYLSMIVSLTGVFAILGLILRCLRNKKEPIFYKALRSFRQGFWLAGIAAGSLFLFQQQILTYLSGGLLIGIFIFLELLVLTRQRSAAS